MEEKLDFYYAFLKKYGQIYTKSVKGNSSCYDFTN